MDDYWGPLTDPASVYEGMNPRAPQTKGEITRYLTDMGVPASLAVQGKPRADAPSAFSAESPEKAYEQIYGEPLTSRSVKSVPINPSTGMPYTTQSASRGATQEQQRAIRDVPPSIAAWTYSPPSGDAQVVKTGSQPNGQSLAGKSGARLTPEPVGARPLPRISGFDPLGSFSGSFADLQSGFGRQKPDDGIIDLSTLDLSDRGAQGMADSQGAPIRAKSGKVYYPGGKAPASAVSGSLMARDTRGPLSQVLGLKTSGLGGLLSGLFGGGGSTAAATTAGGMVPGLGALLNGGAAPAPTYATTPFQEDRFQTTTGAQMPSSMNNSRWTTGY